MSKVRFLLVGGFLGAGKTTAIARLAKHYTSNGLNVGIVTNDQAFDLVDTQTLRALGFNVGEVAGACFCCKFDDLVATVNELSADQLPDVLIAEPVGSCTDLYATVIQPLRHWHKESYEIGPFTVLLKPEHGMKILADENSAGFSPKASYIFLKQLEEADIVVINKIDKIAVEKQKTLVDLVNKRFPNKTICCTSGKTGDGFAELIAELEKEGRPNSETMTVDYDIYAQGEAELGWLNCKLNVQHAQAPFELDSLLLELMNSLKKAMSTINAETAHLKVLAQSGQDIAVANLVSSSESVELSHTSGIKTSKAEFVINARVAIDPDQLVELVQQTATEICSKHALQHELTDLQHFRPAPPVPTHRIVAEE